jgi:hypothetical protein
MVGIMVIFLTAITIFGQEKKENGFVYKVENNQAILYGYEGTSKDLVIPSKLGGLPVTKIDTDYDYNSHLWEKGITSVVIPSGITEIKNAAFTKNNISSLTIPKSVIIIEENAFSENPLSKIIIDENVNIDILKNIGAGFGPWYMYFDRKAGTYTKNGDV